MPPAIGDRRQPSRLQAAPTALLDHALTALPAGHRLPDAVWNRRHRAILMLVWLHLPALAAFGILMGHGLVQSLTEVLPIGACAVLASLSNRSRRFRAVGASLGLLASSASLIHFSGGYIEMHFHFFVVVGIVALYQYWTPFLVTIGSVVLHHGVMATLNPKTVYNHPDAWAHPWRWALIHGAFIVVASAASLSSWCINEYHALHDSLTQLPNRVLFLDRLAVVARRSARRRRRIAILYVDVDDLKLVNDRLGHEAGDRVLLTVAECLCSCARPGDTVARLGGDEFAMLLSGLADEREAVTVATEMLAKLRASIAVSGHDLVVTASIGIATGTSDLDLPGDALRQADAALYVAKRRGKGRYAVFDRFPPSTLSLEPIHPSRITPTWGEAPVAETG